ncbi:lipopolysaccharide biosynthesis protein [Enterobacter ludwigii]|jgi:O-antigen/teichoic acid export membrane protein|uniref:lipopolysaccharide biosynthesis protein n=1 Tax=Enterobacter ludwigii TaxID=299767 RepID=UPI002958C76F|nr:hypothetical protein [Enterobacter ludwigii]
MHGAQSHAEEAFVKNSTYTAIAKIISSNLSASILTFLSLLWLSRIYNANDYGLFTKYYYLLGIMYVVLDLGLPNALVISLSQQGKSFKIIDIINKYKFYFLVVFFFVSVLGLYFFTPIIALSFVICSVVGIILKFNSIKLQIVNDWGNSSKVVFYLPFLRSLGIFGVCFFALGFHERYDSDFIYIVMICASIIALFLSFNKTKGISYAENGVSKNLAGMAWKLYAANIFAIVCMRADVIFISHFFSDAAAGEYARVSMIFFAAPLLAGAINTVFIRGLSAKDLDVNSVKNITWKLFCIAGIGVVSLGIFGLIGKDIIIRYLSLKEIYIFIILTIAYAGTLIFGVWEAFINHRDQSFFLILKICQLIGFVITFLALYKYLGFIVGAVAFLMSRVGGWVLQWVYCHRRKNIFLNT